MGFWYEYPSIRALSSNFNMDGTHLYRKYNISLLIVIGLDAESQLMPLAFALVESENNEFKVS